MYDCMSMNHSTFDYGREMICLFVQDIFNIYILIHTCNAHLICVIYIEVSIDIDIGYKSLEIGNECDTSYNPNNTRI